MRWSQWRPYWRYNCYGLKWRPRKIKLNIFIVSLSRPFRSENICAWQTMTRSIMTSIAYRIRNLHRTIVCGTQYAVLITSKWTEKRTNSSAFPFIFFFKLSAEIKRNYWQCCRWSRLWHSWSSDRCTLITINELQFDCLLRKERIWNERRGRKRNWRNSKMDWKTFFFY